MNREDQATGRARGRGTIGLWMRPASWPRYIEGPWSHRSVSANGIRFHVAGGRRRAAGAAAARIPRVLVDLAESAAVAGSTPASARSPPTCAGTAAATSRRAAMTWSRRPRTRPAWSGRWARRTPSWSATTGAAWSRGPWRAYYPKVVRRLAVVSVPHPLRLRAAVLTDPLGQGAAAGTRWASSCRCCRNGGCCKAARSGSGACCQDWSGPGWPDAETERSYRPAMWCPSVAHSALEYHRWFVRSRLRPDGLRYARACGRRSRRPPCNCTARWTAACCRARPAAPAGTSRRRTGGG